MGMATMHNFFSLGWAVTLACIQGLIQKEGVFLRTPKSMTLSRTWHALRVTQWETAIGIVCAVAGLLAFKADPNVRTFTLCSLLFWQGSLYLAAPFYSLLSSRNKAAHTATIIDRGTPIQEHLAARWAVGLVLAMIFSLSLIRILPSPAELPWYARFMPVDLQLNKIPIRITGADQAAKEQPEPNPEPVSLNAPVATISIHSTHCWSGPGGRYDQVAVLLYGQELQVIGRNADPNNPWWYVNISDSNLQCWLWFYAATTSGPVDDVPIIE
jgi:hypothetical protein